MDKRQTIPEGVTPEASVTLVGVIQKQMVAQFAPNRREEIARGVVEVGAADFPLVAYGEVAKMLALVATGSAVRLAGGLVAASWTTGDKSPHKRLEIQVRSVEVLHDRRRRRVA
jgi:hypothetical protein